MKETVLLVDDEEGVLRSLERVLADEGYRILTARSASEALNILAAETIGVIVSDERMPGMRGAELLDFVRTRHPETVRILLTGQATLEAAIQAVNAGEIFRFFTKPWSDPDLILAVRMALEKYREDLENRRARTLVRHGATS